MRALLLAAGYGTRLKPLTNHLPKCLVPINGKPLIDYWLENLLNNGIEEILINTHYLSSIVQNYIDLSKWKSFVEVVHEETLLGTGGTILKNKEFFRNETFFVAHADNLSIFDMKEFSNRHLNRPSETEITMMLFETSILNLAALYLLTNLA